MNKLPYAEDLNYWQTSQSSADSWMDKTKRVIRQFGGRVTSEAYGSELASGHSAFMLSFEIAGDDFRIIWPVLPSRSKNERAAKIQAATLMYHDVKARVLTAAVFGARTAFFSFWLLPDGRTVGEASIPELSLGVPALLTRQQPALEPGDVIQGEWTEKERKVS